jgi:hypothetical protein
VKSAVVHVHPIGWPYIWTTTAYGLLYVTALVLASVVVFTKRDFK